MATYTTDKIEFGGNIYKLQDSDALPLAGGNVTGPVNFGDSVTMEEASVGDLIITGNASSTNNLQVNTINGVEVGNSPAFTDTTYTAATAAPGKVASTSATGTSTNYARQDHTHGIDLATGDANGQIKIAGTNVSVKGLGALAYQDNVTVTKADVGLDKVENIKLTGIVPVIGTQTAATEHWTGQIDLPALYDGLTIAYYLPYAGLSSKNVTLNLTLLNNTTTGPINVYYTGTTRATTHYAAGSTILLTYWDAGSISVSGTATAEARWTRADYTVSNTNTIGEYAGSCIAGPKGIARYSLIMKVDETHWQSLVLSSGTGKTKAKNTSGFIIDSPILYESAGTYTSGTAAGQSACWHTISFDTRYSTNGDQFSTAGKPFYLVGTITNNKFYLANTWWADSLPTTDSDNVYIYIGQMYSKYQCTLQSVHPIYIHKDGKIQEWFSTKHVLISTTQPTNQQPGDYWFVTEEHITLDYQQTPNDYGGNTAYISSTVQEG